MNFTLTNKRALSWFRSPSLIGAVLVSFVISGCAMVNFSSREFTSRTVSVTETEFQQAFQQAQKAAFQIGLKVRSSNISEETFEAWVHQPLIHVAEMHFAMMASDEGSFMVTIQVRSTKDDTQLIEQFLEEYGKTINITRAS